ncbi:MAG: sugar transferase, partial [Dysgonomonas sp.]
MSRFFSRSGFSYFFIIVDLLIVYLSILAAYFLFRDSLEDYENNYYAFLTVSPYIGIAYIILAHIFELDKPKEFTFFGVTYSVILTIACLFLVTMALIFMARVFAYPRSILLASSACQIVLLVPWHLYLNRKYFANNVNKTSIIIGYNKSKDIAYRLISTRGLSSNIKYICSPDNPMLHKYILQNDVTFIAEDVEASKKQELVNFCLTNKKSVLHSPTYTDIFLFNSRFTQIDDSLVFKVKSLRISPESFIIKRGIDIFLSILALIVFSVPMLIIFLILKTSGGSVFYRQERVTKGGRIFEIIKFRTMVENAEAKSGPVLAQETDPRITKMGHFLRATRLDEIPQIFNILKGDMSVVGPRPERPFFVEQYKEEIPEYDLRHCVKAGLTGFAQVHGKY